MTAIEIVRLVGEEFKNERDEKLEHWIEFAKPLVSKKQFGKLYEHALALLVCHKMKMAGLGENTLGDLGKVANGFSATSVSDGGSSISFANAGGSKLETNAEFGMTVYGTQYLQLLKMCVVPIHISGEEAFNERI